MSLVVPAVLPTSREDLEKKLALFSHIPTVSRIQIDIVDGQLAAPASWPYTDSTGSTTLTTGSSPQAAPVELEAMVQKGEMLPALDSVEYEIDLMCFDALRAAGAWLALGASRLTFHTENAVDLSELLTAARDQYGSTVSFGLALSRESSLARILPCLNEVQYIQYMGIAQIGRQGEPFDERVLEKVGTFHKMYPALPIQVDGGVSLRNAKELLARGVSHLVVGSALMRSNNPVAEVAKFEALQSVYGV